MTAATNDQHGAVRPPDADGAACDAIVIGAGFAGLYALHRLRSMGLSVRSFEAGSEVGGTWFWNRYPGARCDTESVDYSFSFAPEVQDEWDWSEKYAAQPEIRAYLNHVADRFGLRDHILFDTRVVRAWFDEARVRWQVTTDGGQEFSTRFLVMATGVLSSVKEPDFEGFASFAGRTYQTSRWPEEGVDFSGLRVGVIGTGSTGVQAIPVIAKQAQHVVVFQRTPNFSVPARNGPLASEELDRVREHYADRRQAARESKAGIPEPPSPGSALAYSPEQRHEVYERAWRLGGAPRPLRAFDDLSTNVEANATAADFVRAKIAATVTDPAVAARLSPTDHPLGTKRICVDTDYFETYNRDNVTLVDVRSTPIVRFTPEGVLTSTEHHRLDAVVLAIGFDALTGALLDIDIRGRDGVPLRERWADGPHLYLGVAIADFPNLFTVTGPGSPSVLGNVVTSIEQHVEFLTDCISRALERGEVVVEATAEAQDEWMKHVAETGEESLLSKANSWYVGANIPGKPRVVLPYTGGVGRFRQICDDVAKDDYRGFTFDAATDRAPVA
ncbi:MAG: NAD(P)/FAD-dependent oxidoreductase [Mycobacteriales bacterium]